MTNERASEYLDELRLSLELQDTHEDRIADVLRQVESHIADTHEDPYDSFGSPQDYAKQYAPSSAPIRFWPLVVASVLLAVAGGWFLSKGIIDLVGGRPLLWGIEPLWGVVVGALLLVAWVVVLTVAAQARRTRVQSGH
ncbi:hypothetical protein [Microbacterium soli]|uniref:DUF1707 domain-containing protein n=1 Tax=Microbacterium soli TaxID=446075 RepID=A0ABP7N4F1_9MICO